MSWQKKTFHRGENYWRQPDRSHEQGRNWSVRHWPPKKRGDVEGAARTTSTSTRGVGFRPTGAIGLEFKIVLHLSRSVPARVRRMHERNVGRPRNLSNVVLCSRRVCPGRCPSWCGPLLHSGDFDVPPEEGRWCDRHRHRHLLSQVSCQAFG